MKKASTRFKIGKQLIESVNSILSSIIYMMTWLLHFYLVLVLNRVTQIKTYSWDNAQVILVGNKCDMEDERVISFERGKQLADQLGVEFFETSAKENVNVKVSRKLAFVI